MHFANIPDRQEGRKIFARYKYFISAEEAIAWVGAPKPIGGKYCAPDRWVKQMNP
jgi:hypothetical protein